MTLLNISRGFIHILIFTSCRLLLLFDPMATAFKNLISVRYPFFLSLIRWTDMKSIVISLSISMVSSILIWL